MARVCVDSTFFDINSNGELTFKRTSVGLQQMLTLTTPGNSTFTKANFPGLTRIRVRAIGGGGGAGGTAGLATDATSSQGGGGGGYSESVINASSLGASEAIVVGAGGLGGIGQNPGNPGGASSFGGLVIANGGLGSPAASGPAFNEAGFTYGGFGAPVGTGQITSPGGAGQNGVVINDGNATGGIGGSSGGGYGAGGGPIAGNGSGYGGGGGGSLSIFTPLNRNGGNGSNGAVFIDLYY